LEASEHGVRFTGGSLTEIAPDKPGDGSGLVAATSDLAVTDVNQATVSFYIVGRDQLGREEREKVFGHDRTVELIQEGMNVEEVKIRLEWLERF
jgi:hypothetical protein